MKASHVSCERPAYVRTMRGEGAAGSFATDRSSQRSKFFRGVVRRGRIIERDQPSVEPSPIGGFEFKWLTIFAWHVIPIRETVGIEQIFVVSFGQRPSR